VKSAHCDQGDAAKQPRVLRERIRNTSPEDDAPKGPPQVLPHLGEGLARTTRPENADALPDLFPIRPLRHRPLPDGRWLLYLTLWGGGTEIFLDEGTVLAQGRIKLSLLARKSGCTPFYQT